MKTAIAAAIALTLSASPALAALKAGDTAPDFNASAFMAGQPTTFRLADALKKGPVVLYFFPAAYTAGCNIETHMFSEAADQFKANKATLVGITAGNADRLAEYSKDTQYCAGKFPLAADPGAKIAKQYDSTMAQRPEYSNRTSYVIAPNGKVVHVHSDLKPHAHVQETLTAVKTLVARK